MSKMVKKKNPKISKNFKKSQKINFFQQKKNFEIRRKKISEKKCCNLSFPIWGGRDSPRALQSSPFQISGGVVRVWRRRRTNEGQRKSLCLILDTKDQHYPNNSTYKHLPFFNWKVFVWSGGDFGITKILHKRLVSCDEWIVQIYIITVLNL